MPVRLRVRQLREEAGLSQEALATVARTRQCTISELERGRTTRIEFSLLDRLAGAFSNALGRRIEPGDLFERRTRGRGRM